MQCKLQIDSEQFNFEVDGDFSYGADQILFDEHGVLEHVRWQKVGYSNWTSCQRLNLLNLNQVFRIF